LHSAIGYVAPKDRLENKHEEIFKNRDQKLWTSTRKAQNQTTTTNGSDDATLNSHFQFTLNQASCTAD